MILHRAQRHRACSHRLDADAEFDPLICRHSRIPLRYGAVHLDRAAHRIDASFRSGRALGFDGAALAGGGPVMAQELAVFDTVEPPDHQLSAGSGRSSSDARTV